MKNYLGEFINKEWTKQKRELGDYWKVKEGSKIVWKVQCPNGVMSFNTKKLAIRWVETF